MTRLTVVGENWWPLPVDADDVDAEVAALVHAERGPGPGAESLIVDLVSLTSGAEEQDATFACVLPDLDLSASLAYLQCVATEMSDESAGSADETGLITSMIEAYRGDPDLADAEIADFQTQAGRAVRVHSTGAGLTPIGKSRSVVETISYVVPRPDLGALIRLDVAWEAIALSEQLIEAADAVAATLNVSD